jgi:hypothetical protein
MVAAANNKLVIAISSRALFDLDASHEIFEREGVDAYHRYQISHEDEILAPGDAFPLVQKLLRLNDLLHRPASAECQWGLSSLGGTPERTQTPLSWLIGSAAAGPQSQRCHQP